MLYRKNQAKLPLSTSTKRDKINANGLPLSNNVVYEDLVLSGSMDLQLTGNGDLSIADEETSVLASLHRRLQTPPNGYNRSYRRETIDTRTRTSGMENILYAYLSSNITPGALLSSVKNQLVELVESDPRVEVRDIRAVDSFGPYKQIEIIYSLRGVIQRATYDIPVIS